MIATITLNPSLDIAITVHSLMMGDSDKFTRESAGSARGNWGAPGVIGQVASRLSLRVAIGGEGK